MVLNTDTGLHADVVLDVNVVLDIHTVPSTGTVLKIDVVPRRSPCQSCHNSSASTAPKYGAIYGANVGADMAAIM